MPMHLLWTCVPLSPDWVQVAGHDVSNGLYFTYGQLSVGSPGEDVFMSMDTLEDLR